MIKIYSLVELTDNLNGCNKGMEKGIVGIVVQNGEITCEVMFFNNNNMGEYAFCVVPKIQLKVIGEVPADKMEELKIFLQKTDRQSHTAFRDIQIKEYDKVKLKTLKERYLKQGLSEESIGCVVSQYAIKNRVEVDFSKVNASGKIVGGVVIVDIDDIEIVNDL